MNEANLNGNLIREYDKSQLGDEPDALFAVDILAAAENNNPVYGVEGAWGYGYEKKDSNSFGDANFERIYEWDDKNQLIKTKDGLYTTYYVYNNEGDRVAKYTERSETLYFNKFWSWHIDPANAFAGGQLSKHIFLGDTRIVTKLSQETNNYIDAEKQRLYFYHSDHLGSASLITDYKGNEYERLEYTPYGELWVDLSEYTGSTYLPFKFSAKEMDSETGLYYYGARYLDSKYSLWKSTDPALGEYIPKAPINEQARQDNQNLPGMGGIFNPINANLYHYAGNNPVRYVDPDGGKFDLSYLSKKEKQIFEVAIHQLKKIDYAAEIINQIENSAEIFFVKLNRNERNNYDSQTKTLVWDPGKFLYKKRTPHIIGNKIEYEYIDYIDSITLLFHELGHIEQELSGILINDRMITNSEKLQIENDNLTRNEQKVAEKRGNYIRIDYTEIFFTVSKYPLELLEVINEKNN